MTDAVPESQRQGLAETNPLAAGLIAMGVFLLGGLICVWLPRWLAPDSDFAAFISFLALPAAFMLSMVLWQGVTVLFGLFRRITRGKRGVRDTSITGALARKAWLLIPAPVLFNTGTGIATGLLGHSGFALTVGVYAGAGLAYGLLCFGLGRAGMLPILED
ncbi:MAG: hypothetical protein H6839_01035 [Planctomycetes bacterium]|nr:hypothetical protein [Planctomycetota bacterium]